MTPVFFFSFLKRKFFWGLFLFSYTFRCIQQTKKKKKKKKSCLFFGAQHRNNIPPYLSFLISTSPILKIQPCDDVSTPTKEIKHPKSYERVPHSIFPPFFSFHRGQGKDRGVLKKKNIFLPGEPQLTGEKALNTPSVTPYNIFSPPYLYFTFLSPPSWLNMFQVAPPGRRWAILIPFFFSSCTPSYQAIFFL
jgi:hypothetical protein